MSRPITNLTVASALALMSFVGCGGTTPPPEPPPEVEEPEPEPATAPADAGAGAEAEEAGAAAEKPPPPPPKPEFKEGGSVADAINALPPGSERMNLDPETLGRPLQDMKIYEPCKVGARFKVKMRVAVYDGRAVGLDLKVTPKNEKIRSCIDGVVRGLEWKDEVPSLNTVEFSF